MYEDVNKLSIEEIQDLLSRSYNVCPDCDGSITMVTGHGFNDKGEAVGIFEQYCKCGWTDKKSPPKVIVKEKEK